MILAKWMLESETKVTHCQLEHRPFIQIYMITYTQSYSIQTLLEENRSIARKLIIYESSSAFKMLDCSSGDRVLAEKSWVCVCLSLLQHHTPPHTHPDHTPRESLEIMALILKQGDEAE